MRTTSNEQRGIWFKLRGNKNISLKWLWSVVWGARSVRLTVVWNAGILVADDCPSYSPEGPKSTAQPHSPWRPSPGTPAPVPGNHFGSARPQGACAQPCLRPCLCGELVSWTVGSVAGCQLRDPAAFGPWGIPLRLGPEGCLPPGKQARPWAPRFVSQGSPWSAGSPRVPLSSCADRSWLTVMLCRSTSTPPTYFWQERFSSSFV